MYVCMYTCLFVRVCYCVCSIRILIARHSYVDTSLHMNVRISFSCSCHVMSHSRLRVGLAAPAAMRNTAAARSSAGPRSARLLATSRNRTGTRCSRNPPDQDAAAASPTQTHRHTDRQTEMICRHSARIHENEEKFTHTYIHTYIHTCTYIPFLAA